MNIEQNTNKPTSGFLNDKDGKKIDSEKLNAIKKKLLPMKVKEKIKHVLNAIL